MKKFILLNFQCHSIARDIKNLLARVVNSIADIKHDLSNLTVLSVVVVDEENVFAIYVVLSEVVNFPVEKVSVTQITARQMLNIIGEVLWQRVVILSI